MASPIPRWHELVASHDMTGLDELLDNDCVFISPALHSHQKGKALVAHYLRAAMIVLDNGNFRYTHEWQSESSAVLEFELSLGELAINGVDLIRWNAAGKIVEFKVMIRPLKALLKVVELMAAQLAPTAN